MNGAIRVSAPGSLMLFGEHAVLHGKRALVCAVTRRMRVTLAARADGRVGIASSLGRYESDLARLEPEPAFRFVLAAIAHEKPQLKGGFDLEIESEFAPDLGLGSSAAVTVATLAALGAFSGRALDRETVFRSARAVIQRVQGVGSGADAAASVYGGIVAYRMEPLAIRRIAQTHPITVVYSGSKTPTAEVIRSVEERRVAYAAVFHALYEAMNRISDEAVVAIEQRNWTRAGGLMNLAQGLMDSLGVNTPALSDIVHALRAQPGVLGAKISGSGLGDCVVALGRPAALDPKYAVVDAAMSEQGVTLE